MIESQIRIDINLNFDAVKKQVNDSVSQAVMVEGIRLSSYIKQYKLTNQVLNVRTGRLRNSIHSDFHAGTNYFQSKISTNVKYAPAHEYGFRGVVQVKSHKRKINKVWGRVIPTKEIMIGSFARHMNLPERSFMRTALDEQENNIVKAIEKAVDNGMNSL